MVDKNIFFLIQPLEHRKTPPWERNISEHGIIQYIQIVTNKCFCSQVKQSTVFSINDNFKNTPRPNWEIQMDWENDVNVIK